MKKINSNGYGIQMLTAVLIPLMILPACVTCLYFFTGLHFFVQVRLISVVIGSILAILLFVFLAIEFGQDKRQNQFYKGHKAEKIPIGNGRYECQSCGNTAIKASDRICNICGTRFIRKEGSDHGK